jgi:hypothetical protein
MLDVNRPADGLLGKSVVRGEDLLAWGFKQKRSLQSSWSADDKQTLREGVVDYAAGRSLPPGRFTPIAYYLSHYVMERRFSIRDCKRMLRQLTREERSGVNVVNGNMQVPAVGGLEALNDTSESSSESDSDDEVVLYANSSDESDYGED